MLTPTANASKNLRQSVRARDRGITITRHTGRTLPKKVGKGMQTGRMAAMNRRPPT